MLHRFRLLLSSHRDAAENQIARVLPAQVSSVVHAPTFLIYPSGHVLAPLAGRPQFDDNSTRRAGDSTACAAQPDDVKLLFAK